MTTGQDEYTQTVVVMHAKPYCDQFNNNVAEYFHYTLKNFKNLRFCLHAHEHNTKENDIDLARNLALQAGFKTGDHIIVVAGYPVGSGNTNMMRIAQI